MKIAGFTICTVSYLAQAAVLAESVRAYAPGWRFFVGLVDAPPATCAISSLGVTVVPAEALGLPALHAMAQRYGVVELCTALKPSFFRYLFRQHPELEQVHYFDPDIVLFSDLESLEYELSLASVLLTPHHLTPMPLDGAFPGENLALNHGVFNLGYLGLRRTATTPTLLDWWEERMREHCLIDLREGWFVDQLWFNLVPLYFPEVKILRNPGTNVAYWNLHERQITESREVRFAGVLYPLMFYHFSGFSPKRPGQITRRPGRHDSSNQPGLTSLIDEYRRRLLSHGYDSLHAVESVYAAMHRCYQDELTRQFGREHPWRNAVRHLRRAFPEWLKRLAR